MRFILYPEINSYFAKIPACVQASAVTGASTDAFDRATEKILGG